MCACLDHRTTLTSSAPTQCFTTRKRHLSIGLHSSCSKKPNPFWTKPRSKSTLTVTDRISASFPSTVPKDYLNFRRNRFLGLSHLRRQRRHLRPRMERPRMEQGARDDALQIRARTLRPASSNMEIRDGRAGHLGLSLLRMENRAEGKPVDVRSEEMRPCLEMRALTLSSKRMDRLLKVGAFWLGSRRFFVC